MTDNIRHWCSADKLWVKHKYTQKRKSILNSREAQTQRKRQTSNPTWYLYSIHIFMFTVKLKPRESVRLSIPTWHYVYIYTCYVRCIKRIYKCTKYIKNVQIQIINFFFLPDLCRFPGEGKSRPDLGPEIDTQDEETVDGRRNAQGHVEQEGYHLHASCVWMFSCACTYFFTHACRFTRSGRQQGVLVANNTDITTTAEMYDTVQHQERVDWFDGATGPHKCDREAQSAKSSSSSSPKERGRQVLYGETNPTFDSERSRLVAASAQKKTLVGRQFLFFEFVFIFFVHDKLYLAVGFQVHSAHSIVLVCTKQ